MRNANSTGHLALIGSNLIFGLNTPIAKTILGSGTLTPGALTFLRMAGAALLFWGASLCVRGEKVPLKDIGLLFLASFFGVQLNQVAFIQGLSMTSPIDASIVVTAGPILTMLISAIYLKEPITWLKAIGVAVGASGALLLIIQGMRIAQGHGPGNMWGNMLCLLSSFSFAIYLTIFKRLISTYSPITLMKWMFLFATLTCSPLFYKDMMATAFAQLSLDAYLRIGYVVVLATFLAYMLIPIGQKRLRPTVVSMYNYMQPLVTALVAVALGLDVFGWTKGLAAALVCVGVYLVNKSKSRVQLEADKVIKEAEFNPYAAYDESDTDWEDSNPV